MIRGIDIHHYAYLDVCEASTKMKVCYFVSSNTERQLTSILTPSTQCARQKDQDGAMIEFQSVKKPGSSRLRSSQRQHHPFFLSFLLMASRPPSVWLAHGKFSSQQKKKREQQRRHCGVLIRRANIWIASFSSISADLSVFFFWRKGHLFSPLLDLLLVPSTYVWCGSTA